MLADFLQTDDVCVLSIKEFDELFLLLIFIQKTHIEGNYGECGVGDLNVFVASSTKVQRTIVEDVSAHK